MKKDEAYDAVVARLETLKKFDEMIKAKRAERDQVWEIATSITQNMDGMPHGTDVSNKVGNCATKLASIAQETDELIEKYVRQRSEVVEAIESLPAEEFAVLHKHYVQYISWGDIAREMHYSRMQVFRIKQKGIWRLASSDTMLH